MDQLLLAADVVHRPTRRVQVVEAPTDADDEIGIGRGIDRLSGARPVADAEAQRMIFRQRTLGAECGGDGDFQPLGELLQFVPSAGVVDAGPGIAVGALCRGDQLRRLNNAFGVGARRMKFDPRPRVWHVDIGHGVLHI